MGRLSRGLESEDEAEDSSIVTKSCRIGEVMIIRSGKRFIVRKVAHSQIAELGRFVFTALFPRIGFCITLCCNALLLYLLSLIPYYPVVLKRYDNLDDALGSIKPVYKKVLAVGSNTSDGDAVAMTIPIGAIEDDDLWCTHCMDDPAVAVCAFCGCRVSLHSLPSS